MSVCSDGGLGRETSQQLLQIDLGVGVNRGQFFLQGCGIGAGIAADFSKSGQQANGLNDFFFLQGHDAARPGAAAGCSRSTSATGPRTFGTLPTGTLPGASPGSALRAFGGRDQLQQFLRIIEPLLEFRAQGLGRDLGRNADLAGGRIGGHKPHFVDADRGALAVSKSVLDLFDHVLGSGSAQGESPHQLGEFFLRDLVGKMDAGQTGGGQQLREAAFRLPGLQRSAVQQKLVFGDARAGTILRLPWAGLLAIRSR